MSVSDDRAFDAAMLTLRARHPELAGFLKLPRKEEPRVVRARMAQFLQARFAAEGRITREDLEAAGFEANEIEAHFHHAKRIARLPQMAA